MHAFRIVKENWLGLSLITLTWLIFFWRILFGGQIYFLDDLKIIYYPLEHAYQEFQNSGQLPAWSPYFGFGQPLLAWGQLGFFTPLHLLLRIFQPHPIALLNIGIAAYVAVGLAGMYAFLRHQKLSAVASSLGAITFGFCGFTIGHLNHVNFTTATMLLPWLLLCISVFLEKPTLPRTAALAVVAALIPLSGQPQVSLYTFIIAAIWGLVLLISQGKRLLTTHYSLRTISLTLLAAALAFCLASFSILPLREFLPVSDRSGDLSTSELYEFSYPPSHAVTLLFPYHFGNHELYRGAKNFQELAAYVGVIPLLLAFLALFTWRKYIALRATGLLLIIISFAFAPGIYSPIYRFLVENHILGSLAVPGRFVYFFDVGVAILAAVALESLVSRGWPHFAKATRGTTLQKKTGLPAEASAKAGPAGKKTALRHSRGISFAYTSGVLAVILTAANLIWWGWDYNPLTSRDSALSPSPFTQTLKQHEETHGTPARLFATETLPLSGNPSVSAEPTEPIGPLFTVHQQLRIRENVPCLTLPFTLTTEALHSEVNLSFSDGLASPPFFSTSIASDAIAAHPLQRFCVPALQERSGRNIVITLASDTATNIQAFQRLPIADEYSALYVRVPDPTPAQLERSKKVAHLAVDQDKQARADLEKDLLVRHLQAVASSSSARWAGALAVGDFRTFIDAFFANDHDPIDGEGVHALVRNRNFVNMSGITHVAQAIPKHEVSRDSVIAAGYRLVQESILGTTHLRLYENPEAFPKAFLVGTAIWEPGPDQTRHALGKPEYDGRRLIFVSGPTPPAAGALPNAENLNMITFSPNIFESSRAKITRYEPTRVDVQVETSAPAWLVLTDSTTPQWHTFIDDEEAPPYVANTVFRTAYVPAGSHTVSFRYISPAIQQAKILTIIGLIASALLVSLPFLTNKRRKAA